MDEILLLLPDEIFSILLDSPGLSVLIITFLSDEEAAGRLTEKFLAM